MVFKVGCCYKHPSGEMMQIVGGVKTTLYGWTLVAETTKHCDLVPVGQDEDNSDNWEEITEKEWLKNFD